MNNWKQPIPTNLDDIFGEDYGPKLLYFMLIYRAANKDGFFTYKKKTTPIKRGQVIFGKNQWALYLQQDDSTVQRWLEKLEKVYHLVSRQASPNYTIVTLQNYEELVDMSQQVRHSRVSGESAVSPSKSVKSVKSETIYTEILEHYNTVMRRRTKSIPREAIGKWLETYTLEEIKEAINNIPSHNFMNNIELATLFRFRNPNHEEVDYIGMYLNQKKESHPGFTDEEYAILHAPLPVDRSQNGQNT